MFIDEFLSEGYFEKIPLNESSAFAFGNIYRTDSYYPHENRLFWRPVPDPAETTKTIATKFSQVSGAADLYKRSIPLAAPPLKTNEEFIVVKAKYRPVVMLVPQITIDGILPLGSGGKIWRKRSLVGQVFGLTDPKTEKAEFPNEFINRIRLLTYPQLMFLPKHAGLFQVDSMLRLDECQSLFSPHLESTGWRLNKDVRELLRSQFFNLFDNYDDKIFTYYRDALGHEK